MYELLSDGENAKPRETEAAYKRQARKWHPDVCPTSDAKDFFAQQFIRTHQAYDVLSDPVLRQDYDHTLYTKNRGGFIDTWELQLEGLKKRSLTKNSH